MPTDIIDTGVGPELASLRALGAVCRRQSLADCLRRERRETSSASERASECVRVRRQRAKTPLAPATGNEP